MVKYLKSCLLFFIIFFLIQAILAIISENLDIAWGRKLFIMNRASSMFYIVVAILVSIYIVIPEGRSEEKWLSIINESIEKIIVSGR